jgi:Uma2 family endonuclease
MIQALQQPISLDDYRTLCQHTDERYELYRGRLVEMTPPTIEHVRIAKFLERSFDAEIERLGLPWEAFREIGQQTEVDSSRLPDVVVVPRSEIERLANQVAILPEPSLLVVEIVSTNWRDDYLTKFGEYEALGIQEYWIADYAALGARRYLGNPKQPTLFVCTLLDGEYQMSAFCGGDRIVSPVFPELQLTPDQVFHAGV